MARLQAVIVLPTPPLPELTAIDREITRRRESREGPLRSSFARARGPSPDGARSAVDRAMSAHVQRGRRRPALPPSFEARIELLSIEKAEEKLEVLLLDLQEKHSE